MQGLIRQMACHNTSLDLLRSRPDGPTEGVYAKIAQGSLEQKAVVHLLNQHQTPNIRHEGFINKFELEDVEFYLASPKEAALTKCSEFKQSVARDPQVAALNADARFPKDLMMNSSEHSGHLCNEYIVFHGTGCGLAQNPEEATNELGDGFDVRREGGNGKLFGTGTYASPDLTKAWSYAEPFTDAATGKERCVVMLCVAVLGNSTTAGKGQYGSRSNVPTNIDSVTARVDRNSGLYGNETHMPYAEVALSRQGAIRYWGWVVLPTSRAANLKQQSSNSSV